LFFREWSFYVRETIGMCGLKEDVTKSDELARKIR